MTSTKKTTSVAWWSNGKALNLLTFGYYLDGRLIMTGKPSRLAYITNTKVNSGQLDCLVGVKAEHIHLCLVEGNTG